MEHYRKTHTEGERETEREKETEREEEGKQLLFPFAVLSLIPPVGCLDKGVDHRTGIAGFRPVTEERTATCCRVNGMLISGSVN